MEPAHPRDSPADSEDPETGGARAAAPADVLRAQIRDGRRATSAPVDLKFVILPHPQDTERQKEIQTEIRRHVMKDIGKQRRRPRTEARGGLMVHRPRTMQDAPDQGSSSSMFRYENDVVSIDRSLAPLGSFPIAGDARILELVRFAMETTTMYIPFSSIWFQISTTDPGAFHVTLGNAAALWKVVTENRANIHDPELRGHYSQSLVNLRQRLGSVEESITEGVIANVLAHICLNMRHHYWDGWRAHMNGLGLIYRARGGFDDLGYNIRLMMLYYDLTGAMMFDSVPRFPLPPDLTTPARTSRQAPPRLQAIVARLSEASPGLASAARVLEMMSSVADVVNLKSHSVSFWRSDVDALKLISPTIHWLLSMPRLPVNLCAEQNPHHLVAGEMVRLVCLMIASRLKNKFSFFSTEWADLQQKVDQFVIMHSGHFTEQFNDLRYWSLVTAALLRDPAGRGLYVRELSKDIIDVEDLAAADIIGAANETLWVNCLESPSADDLITELMQHIQARQ